MYVWVWVWVCLGGIFADLSRAQMATDISEAHTTLRAEISTKAQDIVNRLMPEKIMVLDQFYKVYRLDPAARRNGACSSYNNDVATHQILIVLGLRRTS